jgi:uncharacterized protein
MGSRGDDESVFTSIKDAAEIEASTIIASVREPEGLSVVIREEDAQERGLPILFAPLGSR